VLTRLNLLNRMDRLYSILIETQLVFMSDLNFKVQHVQGALKSRVRVKSHRLIALYRSTTSLCQGYLSKRAARENRKKISLFRSPHCPIPKYHTAQLANHFQILSWRY
jgi:hypothetical protein